MPVADLNMCWLTVSAHMLHKMWCLCWLICKKYLPAEFWTEKYKKKEEGKTNLKGKDCFRYLFVVNHDFSNSVLNDHCV